MCLAVPSKIIAIDGASADVEVGGIVKKANLSFLKDLKVGDYVLVHAGFAIQKYDESKAQEILKIWEDIQ